MDVHGEDRNQGESFVAVHASSSANELRPICEFRRRNRSPFTRRWILESARTDYRRVSRSRRAFTLCRVLSRLRRVALARERFSVLRCSKFRRSKGTAVGAVISTPI